MRSRLAQALLPPLALPAGLNLAVSAAPNPLPLAQSGLVGNGVAPWGAAGGSAFLCLELSSRFHGVGGTLVERPEWVQTLASGRLN